MLHLLGTIIAVYLVFFIPAYIAYVIWYEVIVRGAKFIAGIFSAKVAPRQVEEPPWESRLFPKQPVE